LIHFAKISQIDKRSFRVRVRVSENMLYVFGQTPIRASVLDPWVQIE